jgi:nucleotide-binding universal stress UspA family protein
MQAMRRVIAATDFSLGSESAIERAVLLARAHGAGLELLHAVDAGAWHALLAVFDVKRLSGEAPAGLLLNERLSTLAASLASKTGLEVGAHGGIGEPAEAIASRVSTTDTDLVVIARRSDPANPGVGSTLMHVLQRAPCPVLVVRNPAERSYERVLAAVDLRDVSWRAATMAIEWFPAAQHTLLSAIEPDWERELLRGRAPLGPEGAAAASLHAQAERQLQRLAHDLCLRPGCHVSSEVVDAAPVRAILDRAASWPADCVAVGHHGQGGLAQRLLGSTALDVLHHIACDVLVVP